MKSKKETFASLLLSFGYRYNLRPVFDDLLTILLCSFSQNLSTGKSYDEDLYMATIAKYEKEVARESFPKLAALLIVEMEERINSSSGNDVLGEFYETNLYRKGASQYFTPWNVCYMMAQMLSGESKESDEPKRILDPSCGSGRNLLAGAACFGKQHSYYGIDIDHTCVKMTALNLFLNGIFHGEVLCADALSPDDFQMSYVLSFLPFGIFRIENREQSRLWHMKKASFPVKQTAPKENLFAKLKDVEPTEKGAQLQLF